MDRTYQRSKQATRPACLPVKGTGRSFWAWPVPGRPGQDPIQARQAAQNRQAKAWPVFIKFHCKLHIFKRKYIYKKDISKYFLYWVIRNNYLSSWLDIILTANIWRSNRLLLTRCCNFFIRLTKLLSAAFDCLLLIYFIYFII